MTKENNKFNANGERKPLITVVMASYNEEKYIAKAIESIIKQSFTAWELIIVDDGSTDNTIKVINDMSYSDNRIRLIRNKSNKGLPESLNKAIELARSDLIARMDADDISLNDRLQIQYDFLKKHPNIDIVGTEAYLIDSMGNKVIHHGLPLKPSDFLVLPFLKPHFFHPSVLIRKNFFTNVGFYDKQYRKSQDKELWLRGLVKGCQYANISKPLIEYRTNNYIRGWHTIISMILSLFKMSNNYNIKNGTLLVVKLSMYLIFLKLGLIRPSSLRK